MGLQKGEKGYAFRWLTPVFSLVCALFLLINAGVCTLVVAGTDWILSLNDLSAYLLELSAVGLPFGETMDAVMTSIKLYVAVVWLFAIMALVLAIVGFVLNKKGSYIFGTVGGGLIALAYFIKSMICFWFGNQLSKNLFVDEIGKPIMLMGGYLFLIFALGVCICIFAAIAISNCDYDKSIADRNLAGENLTYVGFENDVGSDYSRYHDPHPKGRQDPYAPKVESSPDFIPAKAPEYKPEGPTGVIEGTVGMYRGARFVISDNEELIIGRDPRVAQIVIGEGAQNVSREHCKIVYRADANSYMIKDMSKNGTYTAANRTKLPHGTYISVPAGTEIYLGDRSNTFRLG